MVIGKGDIASVLPERDDLLFFASGVSNSSETLETEYQREVNLYSRQDRNARIVYFSSLAVFSESDSRYVNHKRTMEMTIKKYSRRYCIIRIGNIDWGDNPHTLINHFKANPEAEIRDEYRYIVGKEEFLHWIGQIPPWNCEINIPGRMMKVQEVYDEYVGK